MRKGITKKDLDLSLGIHPVAAEEFIDVNKLASETPEKGAC